MRSPEGFGGGEYAAQAQLDPEVESLVEFLDTYNEIQRLMAWIIEAGPGADPLLVGVRRGHVQSLFQSLGLDPESPDALTQLEAAQSGLDDRIRRPKTRVDVPEAGFFKSRIKEIIRAGDDFDPLSISRWTQNGVTDLADVAEYGHTNWSAVSSRSSTVTVGDYIHGVANVMADPVAYHMTFGLPEDDYLSINTDWSIDNGRHRSLAARALGEDFITEAGMASWVPVTIVS